MARIVLYIGHGDFSAASRARSGSASAWSHGSSGRRMRSERSLTVYLRAAGSGAFNQTGSIATQVHVFAICSVGAKYNSSTNLYAPTAGKVATGGSFLTGCREPVLAGAGPGQHVPGRALLHRQRRQELTFGPLTLAPGVINRLGSDGRGTMTLIDVTNDPPPAPRT